MAQRTDAQITTASNVIRDETAAGANTKQRVRDVLVDLNDSKINNDKISTDGTFASAGNTTIPSTQAVKTYVDNSVVPSLFLGLYTSLVNLEAAHPTATSGNWAIVDPGSGTDAVKYLWDEDEGWVSGGSGAGVLGITGDGVDNTDPANPVLSYPTPGDISAANAVHTHAISDVTNLQTNLDAKAAHTNSAVALTDASTIDLTATKHTLTTASSRTFTISYAGDDITIMITLNTTSATMTFPSGSLCISEGVASGDNTLDLAGISGDKYIISIKKFGSDYSVIAKNMTR